jgi:hypothetical protein
MIIFPFIFFQISLLPLAVPLQEECGISNLQIPPEDAQQVFSPIYAQKKYDILGIFFIFDSITYNF